MVNQEKFKSRKFIITIISILVMMVIAAFSLVLLEKLNDVTEVLQTAIMWVGILSCSYIGGNAAINMAEKKKPNGN